MMIRRMDVHGRPSNLFRMTARCHLALAHWKEMVRMAQKSADVAKSKVVAPESRVPLFILSSMRQQF